MTERRAQRLKFPGYLKTNGQSSAMLPAIHRGPGFHLVPELHFNKPVNLPFCSTADEHVICAQVTEVIHRNYGPAALSYCHT